jgi:hypothetical protein
VTLEVGQFRKGANDKWRFVKLGYAKKNDKGQLNVYFDALPLPDEKGCSIVIQERQERQEGSGYTPGPRQAKAEYPDMPDDSDLPF